MTTRWESEFFTAMEHRDLQANTMAINNTGDYILLAGRRYIAIRNLDDLDNDNVRKFPMQSKYDVGSAEWNPTDHNSELCIISSNQRLEVFTWSLGELTLTNTLKAHTRVITDLNWHRTDPNLLASCSVDTFIHIWDLRDPRRPASSLSAIAEASQVRWNPLNPHVLATAHDGDLKLWDQRRGSAPTQYVAAHLAKIHGLDWNPTNPRQLATCSQDNTIKFFDTENPRRAECVLTTNAPVWRARFTPFGNGLVTVVVPQLRRGENSLLLWNTAPEFSAAPVHTFSGHRDVVLEFAWRQRRNAPTPTKHGNVHKSSSHRRRCKGGEYQLVTWSKDQTLLVWRADASLLELCDYTEQAHIDDDFEYSGDESDDLNDQLDIGEDMGHDVVEGARRDDGTVGYIDIPNYSRVNGSYEHADAVERTRTASVALQQEFSLLNVHIGQLEVLQMDVVQRICTVRVVSTRYIATLQVNFPLAYPLGAPPTFLLVPEDSALDDSASAHLLQTLSQVAQLRVQKNRTCLEPCLRQMVATLDQLSSNAPPSMSSPDHTSILATSAGRSSSYNLSFLLQQQLGGGGATNGGADDDACVPFPRCSGARWCGVSGLVCFGRQTPQYKKIGAEVNGYSGDCTPRSLSEFNAIKHRGGAGVASDVTTATWHHGTSRQRSRAKDTTARSAHQSSIHQSASTTTALPRPPLVIIYGTADLFLVSRTLGSGYVLDGDVVTVCRWNAAVARRGAREDLVQAWRLAELVAGPQPAEEEEDCQWTARHPFGAALIHSLITHYAGQGDVQMAAMLSCIFGKEHDMIPRKQSLKSILSPTQLASGKRLLKGGGSPYHTIPPADIVAEGWVIPLLRSARSTSLDNLRLEEITATPTSAGVAALPAPDTGTIVAAEPPHQSAASSALYEYYKCAYAEILSRWNLLYNRAEVLKYSSRTAPTHRGVQFLTDCQHCGKPPSGAGGGGAACAQCRRPALNCVICHVSVRGSANCCLYCGHGGHTRHLHDWFERHDVCPAGCGCRCLINTAGMVTAT